MFKQTKRFFNPEFSCHTYFYIKFIYLRNKLKLARQNKFRITMFSNVDEK